MPTKPTGTGIAALDAFNKWGEDTLGPPVEAVKGVASRGITAIKDYFVKPEPKRDDNLPQNWDDPEHPGAPMPDYYKPGVPTAQVMAQVYGVGMNGKPLPGKQPAPKKASPSSAGLSMGAQQNPEYWDQHPMEVVPRNQRPENLPVAVNFYRADPTGKFGGTNGLETQPGVMDADKLYVYARTLGGATKAGLPTIPKEDAYAFAMKEGRADLGYNAPTSAKGTPKDNHYRDVLAKHYHLPPTYIDFLATIEQKHAVANRTGVPFAMAWNGTGTNGYGQSGAQYAQDLQNHRAAAMAPENKDLRAIIDRGYRDGQKYGLPLKYQYAEKHAAGGAIEIEDGNPAKRRRMI